MVYRWNMVMFGWIRLFFTFCHDLNKEKVIKNKYQGGEGSVLTWASIFDDENCLWKGNNSSNDYQMVLKSKVLPKKHAIAR